eukprot:TRINITY_DN2538_c0_g2_i1.p1 TRINITY_DN2538_c0_g2~~TRINITY_DN2538_c0_g2_i1.p1  ORF type:complete len:346 (+),score=38.80 TRINITY_DN2538_c0_g2_i1:54-1091(+)
MRKFGLIGCGSNVVDKFLSVRAIPKAGEKGYFSSTKIIDGEVVGGVTLNHLAWANTFGLQTALLARQGNDTSGNLVRKEMETLGISTTFIDISPEHVTSESYVIKQDDGERSILMAPGGTSSITEKSVSTLWSNKDALTSPFAQTQLFSTEISQVPLNGVLKLLSSAKKNNVQATALDVDVSPSVAIHEARLGDKDELLKCVCQADILKPARHAAEELLSVLSPLSVEEVGGLDGKKLAGLLMEYTNAKMVALTEGSSGCSIAVAGQDAISLAPPRLAAVTDTTGAGDAFFGGVLASVALLGNPWSCGAPERTIHTIAKTANMVGAMNCQTLGGLPKPGTRLSLA